MKVKLAVAFAVLMFASLTRADSLTDPNGTIYFPDGSVITAETYVPSTFGNGYDGYTQIFFSFPGGSGSALNENPLGAGEWGTISFAQPVYDLLVAWQGYMYMNFGGLGFDESVCDGTVASSYAACPNYGVTSGSTMVSGPVTEMTWDTFSGGGFGGVTSFTYNTPEPATLLLLSAGFIGLAALKLRARPSAQS